MPSIDTDTRLIMTILFVGAVSGVNIYFYTLYGISFPYGALEHAVLFGIVTVGGIMCIKAAFDLFMNDYIEEWLLQRRIDAYWQRKAREEDNRKRVRDSIRSFQQANPMSNIYGDQNLPQLEPETEGVKPTFLTIEQ
jgi:cell division protein FtsX|tara:strand:- start:926 stop:1336 length:411 start_codon:yes stop_codon:yes gene_type:complete